MKGLFPKSIKAIKISSPWDHNCGNMRDLKKIPHPLPKNCHDQMAQFFAWGSQMELSKNPEIFEKIGFEIFHVLYVISVPEYTACTNPVHGVNVRYSFKFQCFVSLMKF